MSSGEQPPPDANGRPKLHGREAVNDALLRIIATLALLAVIVIATGSLLKKLWN
jgi:hypothetical protein